MYGSQKRNLLPRPEFPLSEETIETALEISNLDWCIERIDKRLFEESTPRTTYSFSVPDSKADYPTIFIDSYQSVQFGRHMQMIHYLNSARLADYQTLENVSWSDWREILELAARLYGGLQSVDEIYQACSSSTIPKEERMLWKGQLTGGFCVIEALPAIQSWQTVKRGNIYVTIYESESVFCQVQQKIAEIKKARR